MLFRQPIEYSIVSQTNELPLTLTEVKSHLRIDFTNDDTYLTHLIKVASSFFEEMTGRSLITKTYKTYLDKFPQYNVGIKIRKSKLQSIVSIQYYLNNVLTNYTSQNYYYNDSTGFSEIFLKVNNFYPNEIDEIKNSVVINFTAGYGANETSIPANIKQSLLMFIADCYMNRGDYNCNHYNLAFNNFRPFIIEII